jgi:hypothetical protein
VVLAEKFIKFTNMNLNDLEKQLQELQKIDPTTLTPEQLQELIDKLSSITDIGEEMLHDDIQEMEDEEEYDDDNFEDYLLDIKDYNENKSYDDENNS